MTGKAYPRRKSNMFSSQSARGSTRWCCCAGGCKDCSGARFSWRCVARSERAPRSLCAFPCETGWELAWNLLKLSPRISADWRLTKICSHVDPDPEHSVKPPNAAHFKICTEATIEEAIRFLPLL